MNIFHGHNSILYGKIFLLQVSIRIFPISSEFHPIVISLLPGIEYQHTNIMLTYSQHKVWASVSLYALAASLLIFSIPEISCETEAHNSIDDNSHHEIGDRFARSIKATPLRWGKRNIEKRSTAEDDDGSSEDLVADRETRASPLR